LNIWNDMENRKTDMPGRFLETEYGGYGMGDICIPYPLRCEAY